MNGSLTIGTLDGANIEIRQEAGAETFFLFGLTAEEVSEYRANGYNPMDYYEENSELAQVVNRIRDGYFSHGNKDLFKPIVDYLLYNDQYMLMADFAAYADCQDKVAQAYKDQDKWTKMSILNSARMAKFSSDRTIREYCKEIWDVYAVNIEIG